MYGVKPFQGIKNNDIIGKIEAGERLALPVYCPPAMYNLMCACWSFEPSQRPVISDIKNCLRYDSTLINDQISVLFYLMKTDVFTSLFYLSATQSCACW